MPRYIAGFVIGLIVGLYLTASYPDSVISGFHKLRIPLLAPVSYSPAH